MSHELRTPLNSSLILRHNPRRQPQRQLTPRAGQVWRRRSPPRNDLLAIINDHPGLSKIEAGKVELAPQTVGSLHGSWTELVRPFSRLRSTEDWV